MTIDDESLDYEQTIEEGDIGLPTLYNVAKSEMQRIIQIYLRLMQRSNSLNDLQEDHLTSLDEKIIVLGGLGTNLSPDNATPAEVVQERNRMQGVPFDVERAITAGVYRQVRLKSREMLDLLEEDTEEFTSFTADYLQKKPYMLPFCQHLAGVFSKADLKKVIKGTISDNNISRTGAEALAQLLSQRVIPDQVRKGEILHSLDRTLEGIVRDLVGRLLLESLVANALDMEGLSYKRENEYPSLAGVVYDFRADFVLPNYEQPLAFIEVRKSSSRHASLYAKDKMFSAINWKGRNQDLLGVLVVHGDWTNETLRVMANVFDYVIPLDRLDRLAKDLKAYIVHRDRSKLRWLIQFSIQPNVSNQRR